MFYWGTATAAPQIEGAFDKDGKTESIWDSFAKKPGNIVHNHDLRNACDHYNKWEEDLKTLKDLGVNAYRFSISWPRVKPSIQKITNSKGIDFYDRLVDRLLDYQINPFVTLHHWDLPDYLQSIGGWTSRETISYFNDFTDSVVATLGDRVRYWTPINEPSVIANLGYATGVFAPGVKNYESFLAVTHHLNLAHAEAARIIKKYNYQHQVGTAVTAFPVYPLTEKDHSAAIKMYNAWVDNFLKPLFTGKYPDSFAADLQKYIHDEDPSLLLMQPDFIGFNHYTPHVAWQDESATLGASIKSESDSIKNNNTDFGWKICPEDFYLTMMRLKKDYNDPILIVTENGCAYNDLPNTSEEVIDSRRITYLDIYLKALKKAKLDGCKVEGYFLWSFMDNFEWASGYTQRFGITYVDYNNNYKRIKKESFYWYKDYIQKNYLLET